VHQWDQDFGALYESPDEQFIVAADKTNNVISVWLPSSSGSKSSLEYKYDVPGHPASPEFFVKHNTDKESPDFHDHGACFPMTINTNKANYDGETLACDYYNCDVRDANSSAGNRCLYDANGKDLKLNYTLSADAAVLSPYFGACDACKDTANFDDSGLCVCTPNCGSCASPADYDGSLSGFQCVDFQDVVDGVGSAKFIPAGSVKQGRPYGPGCGFGRTYRTGKTGTKYVATQTDYGKEDGTPGIDIVDIETMEHHCHVDTGVPTFRLIWVPDRHTSVDDNAGSRLLTSVFATLLICFGVALAH